MLNICRMKRLISSLLMAFLIPKIRIYRSIYYQASFSQPLSLSSKIPNRMWSTKQASQGLLDLQQSEGTGPAYRIGGFCLSGLGKSIWES